ncbi:MAG: deoxyribodipyrimidine photo-lyase [Bacteroidota bacterium]|nr:deoxyribodipyrimidine photo-lyase [Bacteroidota bacterium]
MYKNIYPDISGSTSIFWHRRDLRFDDNAGLYYSLKSDSATLPIFIYDTEILDQLPNRQDARIEFIAEYLTKVQKSYREHQSDILILYGKPIDILKELIQHYEVKSVYTNEDYEPYAKDRDSEIVTLLSTVDAKLFSVKDQVIFDFREVLKADGTPYTVYSPYAKQWIKKLDTDPEFYLKPYPTAQFTDNLVKFKAQDAPKVENIGFKPSKIQFPNKEIDLSFVKSYAEVRNYPDRPSTTRMSVHLRFGTVSIRKMVTDTRPVSGKYVAELIWREFYMMILAHFPKNVYQSWRPEYLKIKWNDNDKHLQAWKDGKTGFPMVDAGMRELNETGFMHNRLRMVTAGFLVKNLLIDWRKGEAYFAEKLLDFEQSSNNGGWQWVAGTGNDAAPYFRIFNPISQREQWDENWKYVKKYIPELNSDAYAKPIIDLPSSRDAAIEAYKLARGEASK